MNTNGGPEIIATPSLNSNGGTAGSGTSGQIGVYGAGNIIAGDSRFTDNGTLLDYTGTGGITAPLSSFTGVYTGRTAALRVTGNINDLFFGHSNTEYLCTIGHFSGAGTPFIGFYCYSSATANTLEYASSTNIPAYLGVDISGNLTYNVAAQGTVDTNISSFAAVATIAANGAISAGAAPSNISAGELSAATDASSGSIQLGSDGECLIRRNNGSSTGTNLAVTFDGFSTTAMNLDTTNGLSIDTYINATSGYKINTVAGAASGGSITPTAITVVGGIVTAISGTSDSRLKNVTGSYERGLAAILAINPVRYTWNEVGAKQTGWDTTREHTGFVAQNIQAAVPEAVGTEAAKDGNGEYLTVSDRPIIAALVNAIRELKAEIDALKSAK